jgi:Mn2+/Fe2+ NRAMP family transporter
MSEQNSKRPLGWRALLGVVILAAAILTASSWALGLLLLVWVVPDLFTGKTHFMEEVRREDRPVLFWLIVLTWIALSAYLLIGFVTRSGLRPDTPGLG